MAGARRRRIDTAAEASDPPSATLSSNAPAQKGAKRRKGALPSDANEPATCGGAVKKGRGRAGKSAPPAKALPPIVPAADGVSDIEDLSARVFTKEEVTQYRARLLKWYDQNHRKLPWRRNTHSQRSAGGDEGASEDLSTADFAYRVWVSEIMLQQTQVATVVAYFNRWVTRWPNVAALAEASQEEVNAEWAGLGYYRRARYLLEGARHIVANHGGQLPSTVEELRSIPGIGPYTAAAVSSIAFGRQAAVVDGNVIRVICRLRALGGDWAKQPLSGHIAQLAGQLLDPARPGDCNQALMELGAVQCLKAGAVPCGACPLQGICLAQAAASGDGSVSVSDWPAKAAKVAQRREHVATMALCLRRGAAPTAPTAYCLVRRPEGGLLAGMWEFPSLVTGADGLPAAEASAQLDGLIEELLPSLRIQKAVQRAELGSFKHMFSHIRQSVWVERRLLQVDAAEWARLVVGPGGGGLAAPDGRQLRFVEAASLDPSAYSTGVRKVCKLLPLKTR